MLRRLQQAGHRPIALAGGGTGMIGDPGGKSEERNLLLGATSWPPTWPASAPSSSASSTSATTAGDAAGAAASTTPTGSNRWASSSSSATSGKHFTVNQMMAKESVRARLERPDQGISFTEFSYMLLQAYDFLQLFDAHDCRLQLGGSDQWGNITMGIELIRKTRQAEAYGLTSPLRAQGGRDEVRQDRVRHGVARRAPDQPLPALPVLPPHRGRHRGRPYLRYFTFLDHDTIACARRGDGRAPRAARRATGAGPRGVHLGARRDRDAARAEAAADRRCTRRRSATLDEQTLLEVCAETPTSDLARRRARRTGSPSSTPSSPPAWRSRRARPARTVTQGGVYVNNRRWTTATPRLRLARSDLLFDRYLVLRRGPGLPSPASSDAQVCRPTSTAPGQPRATIEEPIATQDQ